MITDVSISRTGWMECDGAAGNYIKVSAFTDSTLIFGAKFLRQDDGTEARGGITGCIIQEAYAGSRENKKLTTEAMMSEDSKRFDHPKTTKVAEHSTKITLNSSNSELIFLFNWAKDLALNYVMTDTPNTIPCYEAALPGRGSFCLRDWEHMALGAHFLGLDLENITMMKEFAKTATPEFDYVPAWHIDYFGKIWERAHQVPSIFDAIWTSYQQYLWTGNEEWIEDPTLYNYYTNAVTHYLTSHDNAIPNNGIADVPGENGWENTCTYNETSEDSFKEAADGIGMQYQGFRSYAEILKARGDIDGYNKWMTKANNILHLFRTDFWPSS